MSTLFFLDKRASLAPAQAQQIETRLQDAANFFGIAGHITTLRTKQAVVASDELAGLPDDDFAIVWRSDDGYVERHWPLRNATEVKYAAAHFAKHRDEFEFADRYRIANKLGEKAQAYGAELTEYRDLLEKSAGFGCCASTTAVEFIQQRAALVRRSHPDLSQGLAKMAELVAATPEVVHDHEQLVKIAGVLDEADRFTHLNRQYPEGLARPEEVLFELTAKTAQDCLTDLVATTTGKLYERDALEKLAVSQIREWMGDEFADATSAGGVMVDGEKMAAIVPTLDRGMAAMFDRLMQATKTAAIAEEVPTAPVGLSRQDLFALAAGYQPR